MQSSLDWQVVDLIGVLVLIEPKDSWLAPFILLNEDYRLCVLVWQLLFGEQKGKDYVTGTAGNPNGKE